jgi:hypothetical protein
MLFKAPIMRGCEKQSTLDFRNRLATGGEAVEERREAEKFLDGENYFYLFFFVLACAFVI